MKYQYEKNVVPNATGKAQGEVGESALWDGPLNQTGRPHKKGSSSGKDPMQAVTGKPKPGSKDAGRRKSFCARSKGWSSERGLAARRKWNC